MKSITYKVEVIPDDFIDDVSDSALIEEIIFRMRKPEFYDKIKSSEVFSIDDLITDEDYKTLREIFINYKLDESHNRIYEKILSKVI